MINGTTGCFPNKKVSFQFSKQAGDPAASGRIVKMMRRQSVSKALIAALCVTLVAWCAMNGAGQSGRQVKKPATPYPVPTPEPTPTPSEPTEKPKPAFNFIVGLDRFADFSRISLNAYTGVLRNCVDRLNDAPAASAEATTTDLSRSDAVRKAKAQKEVHIVWLQLRSNSMGQTSVNEDPNNVYIQYAVFEPVTGKQVTSGNTYPDAYRNQRVRLPTPSTSGDYYLNLAARGAAERILAHFHLSIPGTGP